MADAEVIVVGAGPVGTVAAYTLAQHGIDVVVLEAAASCEADMRASTFHAPTLAMLDELGIADTLIDAGLKAPVYQYRIRASGEILEFDLREIAAELPYPFRLQCEQYKLARLLAKELDRHDSAEMRFEHRVTWVKQDEVGVSVEAETPSGVRRLRARYLVAADGASSIVRKQLGVQFHGFTYPERFLTLSTDIPLEDFFDELCYVNYVSDPDEWFVLLKVPTTWRLLVPITESQRDEDAVSDDNKTRIFDGLTGNGRAVVTNHRTLYRVHQRVAERFDHGRILLAGDSAHLNNPLGGFGMNSGIHDAWNLCDKLVCILRKDADAEPLLSLYDRQRRTIMHDFIQAQTIRNKKLIEVGTANAKQAEWEEMRSIHRDPCLRRQFLLRQSMMQSRIDEARVQ